MFVCMYVCVTYIDILFLDSSLDFLRPGDFASEFRTYIINEGESITFIMDTYANDYYEEAVLRVCHHDSSPINQSVSCCDCYNSKECEWGTLERSSSSQHICLFMTSQPGLYQFEIYTSHFPCYQSIGGPIKISKNNEVTQDTTIESWILITCVCLFFILLIILVSILKTTRTKCKAKDSTY